MPVFMSRPLPELYDALDPPADDSDGESGFYSLKLDQKSYWRLAGQKYRTNLEPVANPSDARTKMKWQESGPQAAPIWRIPIPLKRKGEITADLVASFDIAVILPTKIVVFRNQSFLVGESRQQVLVDAQNYISKTLGIENIQDVENAVKVRPQKAHEFRGRALSAIVLSRRARENRKGCSNLHTS